jgi:hypothetical protein
MRQKPRCVGGSWLFVGASFVVAAHIYGEYLSRVTTSHNRLGLSLSKCIRHILIAKISDKRSLRTCEAFGPDFDRPLTCTSCVHAHHLTCPARRGERACVCLFLSHLLHTLASAQRATHILSRFPSTSTSNMGLKSCHPPYMNEPLRFI